MPGEESSAAAKSLSGTFSRYVLAVPTGRELSPFSVTEKGVSATQRG